MKFSKEIPVIAIISLPFLYLAYIWNDLPTKVPMHWNLNGEIDRFGEKFELWLIPILLPLLVYIIFLLAPIIDPKNKISKMGNKYAQLKILLTTIMSILALYIIHSVKNQSLDSPNYMVLIIGLLYIILGNYFKTIRANYFIGIRTPWTLENETVWKETHKLGGKMWFIGGLIVVIASLILAKKPTQTLFITITGIITIIPVAYSYFKFKGLESGK